MQSDLSEKVEGIVKGYGIPPNLIKIEITESVVADSFDDLKIAMERLKVFGISFALDDYGQGYYFARLMPMSESLALFESSYCI